MLTEVKSIHGFTIHALDGEIGSLDEILFDDKQWTARYIVVKTGGWLSGRKVLVSPISFGVLDWNERTINVNLTRERIENSPDVDTDKPVSRQFERDYFDYHVWPYYWGGIGVWGSYWYPAGLLPLPAGDSESEPQEAVIPGPSESDHSLRSTKEITSYTVSASNADVGHVEDFIVDTESWRIAYLAVDTRDWWPGKNVLVATDWISAVDWPERIVSVDATSDQVRNAPEWHPGQQISAEFQAELRSYYAGKSKTDSTAHDTVGVGHG